MNLKVVVGGLAAVLVLGGGAAQASVYTQVFEGTVTGVDALGEFGVKGAMMNTTYTETFLIDTSKGADYVAATYEDRYGGSFNGGSDPVSGTLTIDGVTMQVGSTGYRGEAVVKAQPTGAQVSDQAVDLLGSIETDLLGEVTSTNAGGGFPTAFGQSYAVKVDGAVTTAPSTDNALKIMAGGVTLELLQLSPLTAGVMPLAVSAAPEPSTWALMLAGVGMIGTALRRRRRSGVVAA